MAIIVLEAKTREKHGTGAARFDRKAGFIPCVIYGDSKHPESICIASDVLNRHVHKSNFFSTVFEIEGIGKKKQKLIAKDVQFHPITDRPLHVDFMRVGQSSQVSVRVPLIFINELASPGLKLGGVLNVLVHEIDITCNSDNIPEKIEIDLTGFEFHHTVHAYDVQLPESVSLPVGCKNFTIATVVAPTIMKKDSAEEKTAVSEEKSEETAS